jgi:hypothetical protein
MATMGMPLHASRSRPTSEEAGKALPLPESSYRLAQNRLVGENLLRVSRIQPLVRC